MAATVAPATAGAPATPAAAPPDTATAPADVVAVQPDVVPVPSDAAPVPADATPAPSDAAAVAPVDAACAAIVERSNKARAAVGKAIEGIPSQALGPIAPSIDDANYGGCVGDGPRAEGTWALELLSGEVDAASIKEGSDNGAVVELSVGLLWVGPDGKTVSTSHPVSLGFFSSSLAFEKAHDFDRDGRPELVIAVTEGSPDHRDTHFAFFRATDAGVERFWKDVSPAISGLEDIDRDGVLDLLHYDEFEVEQGLNKLAGFPGVTHVVSIDKLERADDAVKRYYLEKCPAKKAARSLAAKDFDAALADATCAWLWGEDGAALARSLNKIARDLGLGEDESSVIAPWLGPGSNPLVKLP